MNLPRSQGNVSAYVNYCIILLEQRHARFVALKGMGRAIVKVRVCMIWT